MIVVAHPSEIGGPDWPSEIATVMQFRNERVVSMQDYPTEAQAISAVEQRARTRRAADAWRAPSPALLSSLLPHDSGCGDWFEELPPDSGVREPRGPRPSVPSSSIALELPPDLL